MRGRAKIGLCRKRALLLDRNTNLDLIPYLELLVVFFSLLSENSMPSFLPELLRLLRVAMSVSRTRASEAWSHRSLVFRQCFIGLKAVSREGILVKKRKVLQRRLRKKGEDT